MELGVQAIFGPSDQLLGSHIQSICEALALPHIETRIDFETQPKKFSINLHPSQQHINNAYKDLMVYLNWTKVAIIYEEDYGLYFNIATKYVFIFVTIGMGCGIGGGQCAHVCPCALCIHIREYVCMYI